jgi:hypothetical protein
MGSVPVPPTLNARSRAINTAMFGILWFGSRIDKLPRVVAKVVVNCRCQMSLPNVVC